MKHPDIFAAMEGLVRPTAATGDEGADEVHIKVFSPAGIF